MKRKILSIAFVAMSALMITAVANNNNENKPCEGKEMCKHHKMGKGKHHARPLFNPFEGIELSDAQKAQFEKLATERKGNFEKNKKDCKNKDVAVRPNPRDMKKKQLEDIKGILTPEQYVKYLENIALNQPMMGKQRHHKQGFDKQGHRRSFPGFRPEGKITPMEKPQNTPE